MTTPTQTVTLDQVFTRHAYNYVGSQTYKDNYYKGRPLLMALRERKMNANGGKYISHRVQLGASPQGKSYAKFERTDLTYVNNETQANFTWTVMWEPCVVPFHDIMESDGSDSAVLGLLESQIDQTDNLIKDNISTMIAQTTKARSTDLNTIPEIVLSSGALGGLNPATAGQTAWASQTTATVDWSSVGIAKTRVMMNSASQGGRFKYDLLLLPKTFYEESLEIGDAAVIINQNAATKMGTKNADLGMDDLSILNRPVIWDFFFNSVTANQSKVYGLNFDGIHLVENSKYSLKMTPFADAFVDGLDARVAWKRYVGQLTCSNRGIQFYETTVT